ncbi:MAG: glycosyltransferase family 4 protein [Phycisphaerae bacterium]|jgi:glycosyltransferase involved in cell wall biosynthesis
MNTSIKTFMLGWEFPPLINGGLGTACYGLTKAMDRLGMNVIFLLPGSGPISFPGKGEGADFSGYQFKNVTFRVIDSPLRGYSSLAPEEAEQLNPEDAGLFDYGSELFAPAEEQKGFKIYGPDLFWSVEKYANKAVKIAKKENFDIIHAHDWMTYPAAMAVSKLKRRPFVAQVHSTEFDRSGENVNQRVYDIERAGMYAADKVIAVSNYTRNIILRRYSVPASKVEVVYNGVEHDKSRDCDLGRLPVKHEKIVLFLGRITMQKGPDYFVAAAKKVLEKMDDVKFVMAGSGDMMNRTIELVARMGIGHKVLFTRFLQASNVRKAFRMADLYVMPSVSEPFGITPLEAMSNNVPVLISKQSGVSEVLKNALKVDFWDTNLMPDRIIAVLKHAPLRKTLCEEGYKESYKFRWEDSAARIYEIYGRTIKRAAS